MPEDQGQPTGAAFGFPEDTPAEDLADPLEGLETEIPEAPDEAPQEEPGEPAPEPSQEQPAEEGEPSEEAPEAEGQEPERLWAGRYRSPEELEEGYRHSQRQYSRVTQRAQDAADRAAQLEEGLRRAIALNEQMAQQLQARQLQQAEYGYEEQAPPGPVGAPGQPDAEVRQQIEEFRAEVQRERAIRDAEQAVADFRKAHPEVALNGPEDTAMAELIEDLSLDVGSSDVLETTLEAARDPNLARVIRAQPDLLESPEGIEHARLLAGFATAKGANPQRTTAQRKAASQAEAAERQRAHVETGGPGVPPQSPDARPKDAIDEMLEIAKKEGRRSAFMGG